MTTLQNRLATLEAKLTRAPGPCFWCQCEGLVGGAECEHRDWELISHEAALTELAEDAA